MPSKSSPVAKTLLRAVFIALRGVCCVALMIEMYHGLVGKGALGGKDKTKSHTQTCKR